MEDIMQELISSLSSDIEYTNYRVIGDKIEIHVRSKRIHANCPVCGTQSSKLDTTYARKVQDLPTLDKKTTLVVHMQSFKCINPECSRKAFAEEFDFVEPRAKRTKRLDKMIMGISIGASAVKAAEIMKAEGIAEVGKDTVLSLQKKK